MFGKIYLLTNKVNEKIYVGQTTQDLDKYIAGVLYKKKFNNNRLLDKAIQKYGPEVWSYKVLATAESRKELDELEIKFIADLDARNNSVGYNITRGGERGPGWPKGNTNGAGWTPEKLKRTHAKISKALKGRPFSEEHKANLSLSRLGSKNHMTGKKHSPETIAKMRESAKNRKI